MKARACAWNGEQRYLERACRNAAEKWRVRVCKCSIPPFPSGASPLGRTSAIVQMETWSPMKGMHTKFGVWNAYSRAPWICCTRTRQSIFEYFNDTRLVTFYVVHCKCSMEKCYIVEHFQVKIDINGQTRAARLAGSPFSNVGKSCDRLPDMRVTTFSTWLSIFVPEFLPRSILAQARKLILDHQRTAVNNQNRQKKYRTYSGVSEISISRFNIDIDFFYVNIRYFSIFVSCPGWIKMPLAKLWKNHTSRCKGQIVTVSGQQPGP